MLVLTVSDILKVLGDSLGDADLTDGHAKGLHQLHGIVMRAVCRTEAWHRDADDALTVKAEFVESLHGHEQSQRRVQASADANDGLLGVDMIEPFGKACHLDIQDLLATVGHIVTLGDERMGIDFSQQFELFRSHGLAHDLMGMSMSLGIDKGGVHPALSTQFLHIDLTHL